MQRATLPGTVLLLAACLPSHRLVADGNRQFERCYGTDFEVRATDAERELCWSTWLARHTRHQAASKVDYALVRIESLTGGVALAPLPGMGGPVDGGAAAPPRSAPEHLFDAGLPSGCEPACDHALSSCEMHCTARDLACQRVCATERARCIDGCH
ncbi:MAG: hypothetical protein RL385_1866 [Pseudomonadota bacterium]